MSTPPSHPVYGAPHIYIKNVSKEGTYGQCRWVYEIGDNTYYLISEKRVQRGIHKGDIVVSPKKGLTTSRACVFNADHTRGTVCQITSLTKNWAEVQCGGRYISVSRKHIFRF